MANINRSSESKDRRTTGGKGDLARSNEDYKAYRGAPYWVKLAERKEKERQQAERDRQTG